MGSDASQLPRSSYRNSFQSTPPHGERLPSSDNILRQSCFNPRPRMGSDIALSPTVRSLTVSIHAPAWGATTIINRDLVCTLVSIHAPAWGATVTIYCAPISCCVSIHAPAWGATEDTDIVCFNLGSFNPRPRMGSDGQFNSESAGMPVSIHAPAWAMAFT